MNDRIFFMFQRHTTSPPLFSVILQLQFLMAFYLYIKSPCSGFLTQFIKFFKSVMSQGVSKSAKRPCLNQPGPLLLLHIFLYFFRPGTFSNYMGWILKSIYWAVSQTDSGQIGHGSRPLASTV